MDIHKAIKSPSALIGGIGVLLAATDNFKTFSELLHTNFWLTWLVGAALLFAGLWPVHRSRTIGFADSIQRKEGSPRSRWIPLGVSLIVLGYVAAHRLWIVNVSSAGPHPYPETGGAPSAIGAPAIEPAGENISLDATLDFRLLTDKTSFEETAQPKFAAGEQIRTYLLDYDLMSSIWNGKPNPLFEKYSKEAHHALLKYIHDSSQIDLLKYVENPKDLANLPFKHPDIAQRLLPENEGWNALSPYEHRAATAWIKYCIGFPYPVFSVTVDNHDDSELRVTDIVYHVYEIGGVMGGEGGPKSPKTRYIHELKYDVGDQRYSLTPSFTVPPNGSASFELQLFTTYPDLGLAWIMAVELRTTRGSLSTDHFQLIMSGRPEWAKSRFK